ncbi:MAG: ATP phosphoribosyltransferase [Candidatus Altiarchaeales archaeon]|nr:MAG: ATP phosphoribosyltransferase [Candidatus Altiarchaeales archaeon]
MIKFYIPDGHLEEKTLELFERAGFKIRISERGYNPEIDDKEIVLKRIRPQDFPFVLSLGKGDLAITGSDIFKEFCLKFPKEAEKLKELLDLKFGRTTLCVAVSEEIMPDVKNIDDFKEYCEKIKGEGGEVVVATEYPNIAREYLKKNGIEAIIRKPAGKTEAWIIPPMPEADLIIETTETGRTLRENRCRIIDTVMEATARLIANRDSLKDKEKRKKIDEIVELFKGALRGKGKVNVYMNVLNPKNLDSVLDVIKEYVKNPTISNLKGGGYDIFIVIDEMDLKYILPELIRRGASSIAISDTRMIIE